MKYPLVVFPMQGLGDSIYQRPLIRWHAQRRGVVYLRTSWPELFADIPGVRFVEPDSVDLRTQVKNIKRKPDGFWDRAPVRAERIRARYALENPADSVMSELKRSYGLPGAAPVKLDLPDFGHPPVRYQRYAVIRPVTHRKEWLNTARSPDPAYIHEAAKLLTLAGYRVVSVADLEDDKNQEWLEGEEPPVDRQFHRGELTIEKLMAMVQKADVVVGGVGWIVPAAIAANVPAIIIGGGQGAYNAPEIVMGPPGSAPLMRWLLPDHYCRCQQRLHACPKTITNFGARFSEALAAVSAASVGAVA